MTTNTPGTWIAYKYSKAEARHDPVTGLPVMYQVQTLPDINSKSGGIHTEWQREEV